MTSYGPKDLADSFRTVRKNTIQVAQDMAVRTRMARALALRTIAPIAAAAPLLMFVIWCVVSWSLRPVKREPAPLRGFLPALAREIAAGRAEREPVAAALDGLGHLDELVGA